MTVQPFRLGDTAFARLGAGRPDGDTLGALRRAEHSRSLLLLREVRRQVSDTPAWYAAQLATAPEEAARWVTDPMTALWAAHCLRSGPCDPGPRGPHVLTVTRNGLPLTVRLEDTDPIRSRLGLTPAPPLAADQARRWHELLDRAWELLAGRHRPAAEVLAAVLRVIVPVLPDPVAEGISATSAEAFGAVALSAPATPDALAAGLLHETQHSILNATHLLFPLVEPDGPPGYSPWRDDPRPAFGVLHGAYAYLAVTRFRRSAPGAAAAFEFARWRGAVAEAAEALLTGGELTPAGTRFVTALRDEVTPWLDEPVDPAIQRLADLANADHRARWRLRNLAVDDADTARLVAAWDAGSEPPEITPVLVPGGGRALENSPRLPLIRAVLHGSKPGDGADAATVRGDDRAALPAYEKGRDWGGLALVSPHPALRRRPEVVRAAATALPQAPLNALAAWLS
ncbi:aKG-HExxH-type peptide beta-hydroxylase [Actinoplanes utahensis]|uniref:HEXXH motif domain-containing protein n=1 Tax=Actinoplanes utahensis TaxID=1869 RepID=A0A0A6XG11_ACTUT|nr:HEXXH motif-containing putative peptide modification protein [Actinoplanes utahensis]KHD79052.1 hypothetical protein MB27_01885 [Actinoplanes utahensis]GIF28170.1 hypothetical protein Aut01nite_11560 [Actinoplanes utahensis]